MNDDTTEDYLHRMADHPILTRQQEVDLAKRIERGDLVAKRRLVECNVRLVMSVANRFQNRGLDFEDLVQEGTIGLIRAAEKFDYRKGFKFSTYGTWWVTQACQRAIDKKGQAVKTPQHITARRRQAEALMQAEPGIDKAEVAERIKCTIAELDYSMSTARVVASLDVETEEARSIHETVADPTAIDPSELLFTSDKIFDALRKLRPDERKAIELRYGFDGPPRTRKTVAKIMGLDAGPALSAELRGLQKLAVFLADLDPKLEEL